MTTLAITGWGVVNSLGVGAADFTRGVAVPPVGGHERTLTDYRIADQLGRGRTSSLDRVAAFAIQASGLALKDAELEVDDDIRDEVGVVLGSHAGSIQSTADLVRDSYVRRRPFDVSPSLFPNGALSAAAARVAMWYGLQGVNSTLSQGQVSSLSAFKYARNMLRSGQASVLLTGSGDEQTPYTATLAQYYRSSYGLSVPQGEGAAVFVVQDADQVRGRPVLGEILAVDLAVGSFRQNGSDVAATLAGCIRAALERAGVAPEEVWAAVTGENGSPRLDEAERDGVLTALGGEPGRWVRAKELVGEMFGAAGAFQLAVLLSLHRNDPTLDGRVSVVTCVDPAGPVGALVIRGRHRASQAHGSKGG